MTHVVSAKASRAIAEARRAKHAQRNPLPTRAVGNPTAEALLDELEKRRAKKG